MSAEQMDKETWGAPERNKAVILALLAPRFPKTGMVLEIASGTGQHMAHFAAASPHLTFQPTDFDADHLPSIDAWCSEIEHVRPALQLDVCSAWPVVPDVIYCANMIHIAPWSAAQGLFAGAGRHLSAGGRLFLYGPFSFDGEFTARSNAAFNTSLQSRDSTWGVRDVVDLDALAKAAGLMRTETLEMPANNHLLVYEKS